MGRARAKLAVAVVALLGVMFLAALPARAYLAQRSERARAAAEVAALDAQNRALDARAHLLQTDDEIERLARQDYDLVRPGEQKFAIVATPGAPAVPAASTARPARPDVVHRVLSHLTDVF